MPQKSGKKYVLKIQRDYKVKPVEFEALFCGINMGLLPKIARKHGMNRRQLETLCLGWKIQQEKHGFFTNATIHAKVVGLYALVKRNTQFLNENGYIEVAVVESTYRTKKYRLTAKGLAVIRDYSRTMRKAVEAATREEFELPG